MSVCCNTDAVQLSQVEQALESDAGNAELVSLRDELANLIALTKEYHAAQDTAKSKPTAQPRSEDAPALHAGDECMARHQADGRWYPAKITSVAGSAENPIYSILYTKLRTTDVVSRADIRPRQVHANAQAAAAQPAYAKPKSTAASRPMTSDERERERERKRVRKEKKMEREAAKNREHDAKQSAWQKFQAKAVKKKYGVAGDRSMFKTPDDPYAKSTSTNLTGAVGSSGGRGMTKQAPRMKHTYEEGGEA